MPEHRRVYLKRFRRRGRMIYAVRWFDDEGAERCKTLGPCNELTKREAEKKRRQFEAELFNGDHREPASKPLTLGEFREYMIQAIEPDVAPATLDCYERCLNEVVDISGATTSIGRVNTASVVRLKQAMTQRGCSPSSIRSTIAALKAIWNRAKRLQLVTDNPFAVDPLPKRRQRRKRIFTPAEIHAMVAVAPTLWWKAFVTTLYTSGLRKTEALMLLWDDIDFEKGYVHVTPKRAGTFTANGESLPILPWSAKNHQQRSVPIPEHTTRLLSQLRAEGDGSRYAFLAIERLRAIRQRLQSGTMRRRFDFANNLPREFQRVQKNAAAHAKRTDWQIGCLHDLRKTFGTQLATQVPMDSLRQLMGHRDITTTAEYYVGSIAVEDDVRRTFDPSVIMRG